MKAYEEVIDFIASGPNSQTIADFEASSEVRERVADLIFRSKTGGLTPDEQSELEHFLELEHIMRLAKARARQYIRNE